MAKEKRSASDLDAELAALEAELAALEGKPRKKVEKPAKKKDAPAPASASEPTRESAIAPEAEAQPVAQEKKSRFSMPSMPKLPKLGRKKDAQPPPTTDAPAASAPALRSGETAAAHPFVAAEDGGTRVDELTTAPQKAFEPHHQYDLSLWRQEGDAWIRVVPETPLPVVRRILDENGNVVREESAEKRDVESVSSVRAERGLGRLLRRKG